ncbi:MAG: hypothetical protein RRY53_07800, partial [Pseudoflavonifractor sp.]
LKSRRLGFVLRKSTLALLRLEGHIQAGDAAGVAADGAALDAMRLRPEERLEYEQKSMSFLLARGDYEGARACLAKLEKLLEREPDEKLREILADARLLIGIYADRDVTLIPVLEEQAAVQKDNQRGVTCYRLAKLCHFDGADGRAEDWLRQGLPLLRGTPWEPVMTAALGDRRVLDER